jgi:polyhydroxybutyrate depolymerase
VAAPGLVEECDLVSDDVSRSYLRYVPAGVDRDEPAALLISLHAATQNPHTQMAWFPFDEVADREGFIVVAPAAVDGFWNLAVTDDQGCDLMRLSHECGMIDPFTDEVVEPPSPDCRPESEEQPDRAVVDDLGFLEDLIASMSTEYTIDEDRVYLTGASWGGWMASRAACALGDRFAAIAALTNTVWYVPGCEADVPMPFIGIGGADDVYHPACMAEVSSARWAGHNGCAATATHETVAGGVSRITYSRCSGDASVVVYVATGLWTYPEMAVPGGFEPLDVIWEFFEAHARR